MDTETLVLVLEALQRSALHIGDPAARRARLARPEVDERMHWARLAELGVSGIGVPEADGGLGGGAVELAEVSRVLATGLLIEPWAAAAVLAGSILRAVVPEHELASAVLSGESLVVPVGGRLGCREGLRCVRSPAGWRLSGSASVVEGAAMADAWLIAAQDAEGGWHLFVSTPAAEVLRRDFRLMDGRSASDLRFDDLALPWSACIASGEVALAALERAATLAAVTACAESVGAMEQLMRITRDYLNTRVQFGVPIGSFQALQHRLADMQMLMLEARAITRALAEHASEGGAEPRRLRSQAATVVARAGAKVGHESIQMHGGMGVTEELVVGHYNARLVVLARQMQAAVPGVSPLDE